MPEWLPLDVQRSESQYETDMVSARGGYAMTNIEAIRQVLYDATSPLSPIALAAKCRELGKDSIDASLCRSQKVLVLPIDSYMACMYDMSSEYQTSQD